MNVLASCAASVSKRGNTVDEGKSLGESKIEIAELKCCSSSRICLQLILDNLFVLYYNFSCRVFAFV